VGTEEEWQGRENGEKVEMVESGSDGRRK